MIGKEKLFAKLEKVLAKSKADQTEIVFVGSESALTRYANSHIHQNVSENNSRIFFRSVIGKRVGVASTNSLIPADLIKTLKDSTAIAKTQPENPLFPGLPKPAKYRELETFNELVDLVRSILEEQTQLEKATETERKQRARALLED